MEKFLSAFIIAIILILIVVGFSYPALTSAITPTIIGTNYNGATNFSANDTYVTLANVPVQSVAGIYNDSTHTCPLPASRYTLTGNQVKINTNSTVGGLGACPTNYTTGVWFVDYYGGDVVDNGTSVMLGVIGIIFLIGFFLVVARSVGVL